MNEQRLARRLDETWRDGPLPWLSTQAACAGFAVALLYTLGSTLFILANGAEDMPFAYLWSAVLIPPLCFTYNRMQRRHPVARLNRATIVLFVVMCLFAWVLARSTRLDIAAYMLFVGYTLSLAFLTITVTSQANRLFTPDELTRRFPQMLAVQTVALIVCGVVVAPLGRLLHGDIQTLLVGAAVLGVMWVAHEHTVRRYPHLSVANGASELMPQKIEQVLQQALPRWLLLYRVLSSMSSLLIIYLVPVTAEPVYTRAEDLTRVFGYLIAAATLGALVFLLFGAARVLLRWGIRLGLLINPLGVSSLLVLMLIVSLATPEHLLFLLMFAAGVRALDFILAIGITETALNTLIKQLPDASQLTLINAVSALAVPLSYALAAALLLLLRVFEAGLTTLVGATLLTCLLWAMVGGRLVLMLETH